MCVYAYACKKICTSPDICMRVMFARALCTNFPLGYQALCMHAKSWAASGGRREAGSTSQRAGRLPERITASARLRPTMANVLG